MPTTKKIPNIFTKSSIDLVGNQPLNTKQGYTVTSMIRKYVIKLDHI
ncbi:hypothetical protein [Lactobacillus sp. ESL0260]|nr:hypothetical protein [Lactobacillus sp. ESL0260]